MGRLGKEGWGGWVRRDGEEGWGGWVSRGELGGGRRDGEACWVSGEG